jgi:hypothetical protein
MGSCALPKKSFWTFAFSFFLFNLATRVEGQRVIASLGSKLKRFRERSERAAKGKYAIEEGENHDDRQEFSFFLRGGKHWNSFAMMVTSLVVGVVVWSSLGSSVPEEGEFWVGGGKEDPFEETK